MHFPLQTKKTKNSKQHIWGVNKFCDVVLRRNQIDFRLILGFPIKEVLRLRCGDGRWDDRGEREASGTEAHAEPYLMWVFLRLDVGVVLCFERCAAFCFFLCLPPVCSEKMMWPQSGVCLIFMDWLVVSYNYYYWVGIDGASLPAQQCIQH